MHEIFTREVFWAKESKNEVKNGIPEEQIALKFISLGMLFENFSQLEIFCMLEPPQNVLNVVLS